MPNHARTQYFYGVALNDRGRFPEGLAFLQRAHELEPNNPEYLIGLATTCRDAGRFDLATEYARKLVELNPQVPDYQGLYQDILRRAQQQR